MRPGERDAEDRRRDRVLLDLALSKERAQLAEEQGKRDQEKEITRKYQAFLQEQMAREAENEGVLEELRRKDEERVWLKRDAELKAQDDARAFLLQQVKAGRAQQMREGAERALVDQRLDDEQAREDRRAHEEGVSLDEQKRRDAFERTRAAAEDLKRQIDVRDGARRREVQEKYLANKALAKMEAKQAKRLADQAGQVRTNFPVSSVQWYT